MKEMKEMKAIFPALEAQDIEVKLNPGTREAGFEVILYKSAVIDSIMLDRVFGPLGWKKENQTILRPDGTEKLTCTISVYDETAGWVSKDGVGTCTDWEAEKGQETDAMKRAGFQWGIGRELKFHMPKIYFPYDGCKFCFEYGEDAQQRPLYVTRDKFIVEQVIYDDEDSISRRIAAISIRDVTNNTRVKFDIREELKKQHEKDNSSASAPEGKKGKRGDNAVTPKLEKKVTEEIPEEQQIEGQMEITEILGEIPTPAPMKTADETPSFTYDGEPKNCLVPVAKWKGTETTLGDLSPRELRFVFMKSDTPEAVKHCAKLLAKQSSEIKAEFIKNGIPV